MWEYTADIYTVGVEKKPNRITKRKHFTEVTQSVKVYSGVLYLYQNYFICVFSRSSKNIFWIQGKTK